jgi:DNA-binding CsgD family transcriptional regulator/tetratricopeptide (TPR) repeat protein
MRGDHQAMSDRASRKGVLGMPEPTEGLTASRCATEPDVVSLVGREREQRLLDALAASVTGGGAAGVVIGEPGVGKTALLEHVARTSAARVTWVRGEESDASLPFAAASDLLHPFLDHLSVLPTAQRQALEVALALADHPSLGPARPLAVCAGALGLLSAAGDRDPLVLLVDDLQWIDPESAQLITFVARRLSTERVVMLLALQDAMTIDPPPRLPPSLRDLPTLRLAGLSLSECQELATIHGYQVSQAELASLMASIRGNPLALLERLEADRGQADPARGPWRAVHRSTRRSWACLLRDLPDRTHRALFVVAAAMGSSAAPHLARALEDLDLSMADLQPAELEGLVQASSEPRICHPLLRQVLLDTTATAVRLESYRALAAVARPDQRVWFHSLATLGPDEDVAKELVVAADDARERVGFGAALRLSRRAAELTPDPLLRAERLLDAAGDAHLVGASHDAVRLCREALTLHHGRAFGVVATIALGRALTLSGHPEQGYEAMVSTADALADVDPQRAAQLFAEATVPALAAGAGHHAIRAAVSSEHMLAGGAVPDFPMLVMLAAAHLARGDVAHGQRRLESAETMLPDDRSFGSQLALMALAHGWALVERFDRARTLANQCLDVARRHGAGTLLAAALNLRSELDFANGRWAAALADATEAVQWAEELHQPGMLGLSLVGLARIEAARGCREECEIHVHRAREVAGAFGLSVLQVREEAVLGFSALTSGEPEAAVAHLSRAWRQSVDAGHSHPALAPALPDLIEAYVRTGDRVAGRSLLDRLEEQARRTGLAAPAAAAARCRGLLADDPAMAADAFHEARREHARCPMSFESARTLLCEAEVLRRGRRPAAARVVLGDAAKIFESLGARPWLARTQTEIAAAGGRVAEVGWHALGRKGVTTDDARRRLVDHLTAQEMQIARMVSAGHNNAEIGAILFLSRKTVEAHLTRVYRKLEVRSRTDLTRVLSAQGIEG